MASSASFIVTPNLFRAVTTVPSGNCRSITLTKGVTRGLVRMSLSSTLVDDVLIFLFTDVSILAKRLHERRWALLPPRFLCFHGDLERRFGNVCDCQFQPQQPLNIVKPYTSLLHWAPRGHSSSSYEPSPWAVRMRGLGRLSRPWREVPSW